MQARQVTGAPRDLLVMPLEHRPDTIRMIRSFKATRVPLHLSVDPFNDFLGAIEFGAVCDLKPDDETVEIGEGFLFRSRGGPINGFEVSDLTDFDPDDQGDVLWAGPQFAVPALGLRRASPAQIILAARATFTKLPTADVCFFWSAVTAGEEGNRAEAADHWLSCIEAGGMRGHFGLGYTLCELDRPREGEGYAHLRFYTEIAPRNPWAWAWRGLAVGDGRGRRGAPLLQARHAVAVRSGDRDVCRGAAGAARCDNVTPLGARVAELAAGSSRAPGHRYMADPQAGSLRASPHATGVGYESCGWQRGT